MQKLLTESNVIGYLRSARPELTDAWETARCEVAGDGNINWVRRVRTAGGSVVVKQAGPALQKFPEYAVSPDRILHEARYYRATARFDRDRVCPALLHVDADQRVLVLEDLGDAERLDHALRRGADTGPGLCAIAAFLGRVHAGTRDPATRAPFPDGASDDGVLRLHLDHIFRLPFEPNDFPLPPALQPAAREVAGDADLLGRLAALDARCRERADALVHGDVQPTNILLAESGAKLLDAETAHSGQPFFELGVLFAHLVLAELARGTPEAAGERVAAPWQTYRDARGDAPRDWGFGDVAAVAGVELLRRTLGAARVPEVDDDAVGLEAVRLGTALLRAPPDGPEGLGAPT